MLMQMTLGGGVCSVLGRQIHRTRQQAHALQDGGHTTPYHMLVHCCTVARTFRAAAAAAVDAELQRCPPGVCKGSEAVRGALQQRNHGPQPLQHGQPGGHLGKRAAAMAQQVRFTTRSGL
jgi:hypothetical protein